MGTRLRSATVHLAVTIFLLLLYINVGEAGWGSWSAWTPCSATCGNGAQTRIRHCTTDPKDSLKCGYVNQTEEYQCDSGKMCKPADGGWSSWGPWNNCSRRCGVGFHERWRKCDNPKPRYGGKVCNGTIQESAPCINPACPPLYFGEKQTDCSEGHVHCANGHQCVPEYRRCDFWQDCRDGSDESACREGDPVQIFYKNNSGISLTMCSLVFPILSSGFSWWLFSLRR